MTEKFSEV